MSENVGAVYLTADKDRAVFLTGSDLTILRDMLDVLEARPTVAGPELDVEGLARLSRAVDLDEDDDAPRTAIALSASEQRCLDLLRGQSVIRVKLPLRIRYTCTACGNERMVNPARQAKATDTTRSESSDQSFLASAELFSDGHPFLAALSFLGGLGSASGSTAAQTPVCVRCDGEEFEIIPVTFCPGCRAVRDESVVLQCPECEFDFLGLGTSEPLWTSPPEATAQYSLARNQAILRKAAGTFENSLWPGQSQALVNALRPDEQLLGMCRCGLPGELGRYVALLLTTEQLVWAWESAVSPTKSGKVRWRDVRAIRAQGNMHARNEWGVRIEIAGGAPIVLTDFRGVGISFGNPPLQFTADNVLRFMAGLYQQNAQPGQELAATPAPPVSGAPQPSLVPYQAVPSPPPPTAGLPHRPVPPTHPSPHAGAQHRSAAGRGGQPNTPHAPPPPGWYPDPWRQARLRWWSGTQWTSNLSR